MLCQEALDSVPFVSTCSAFVSLTRWRDIETGAQLCKYYRAKAKWDI